MNPSNPLPSHARVVIIGGGVVGCSILFHLARMGWKEVVLLERAELTSGSSWHAAGQIHTISSDPNISKLQGYTINLYPELEKLSGQSVGHHKTGGFYLASSPERLDYLKQERSKACYMGLDHLMPCQTIAKLLPGLSSMWWHQTQLILQNGIMHAPCILLYMSLSYQCPRN